MFGLPYLNLGDGRYVYDIHPGVNPLWQAYCNMKNSFDVAPAMSAPKMADWPRPNGLKFFWLIGKTRPKTCNSTSCPKKMFSLRYNFFLKPRHSWGVKTHICFRGVMETPRNIPSRPGRKSWPW